MKRHTYLSLFLSFLIIFLSISCSYVFQKRYPVHNVDHSDPWKFSKPTAQTTLSATTLKNLNQRFPGKNSMRKIGNVISWIRKNFDTYKGGGMMVAKQSAQEIYDSRKLSGCNDWGILLSAILRSQGFPVVFLNAAGIAWAKTYKKSPITSFSGHVFLEIYVDERWIVMDSVTGEYIDDYDMNDPVIPIPKKNAAERGYFVYQKGLDHWTMGIRSIQDSKKIMREFALNYPLDQILIKSKKIKKATFSS